MSNENSNKSDYAKEHSIHSCTVETSIATHVYAISEFLVIYVDNHKNNILENNIVDPNVYGTFESEISEAMANVKNVCVELLEIMINDSKEREVFKYVLVWHEKGLLAKKDLHNILKLEKFFIASLKRVVKKLENKKNEEILYNDQSDQQLSGVTEIEKMIKRLTGFCNIMSYEFEILRDIEQKVMKRNDKDNEKLVKQDTDAKNTLMTYMKLAFIIYKFD